MILAHDASAQYQIARSRRFPHACRGELNRLDDPVIGTATAEMKVHRLTDLRFGRSRVAIKEGCRRNQLTGLAIPALGDADVDPGLLHRVEGAASSQSFNRR